MSAISNLLKLAAAYGHAFDAGTSTVSWRVFGDTKKLQALMDGKDIQVKRAEAALQWFSDNWPDGAEWPQGVARPDPTPSSAPTNEAA